MTQLPNLDFQDPTVTIRLLEDLQAPPYRMNNPLFKRLHHYGVPAVQVDRLGLDNPPAARVEIGA